MPSSSSSSSSSSSCSAASPPSPPTLSAAAAIIAPPPPPPPSATATTTSTTPVIVDMRDLECDLACTICQELFVDPVTTECGHSFCRQCLNVWLKTKLCCPVCRVPISKVPVSCICLERAVEFVVVALSGDKASAFMQRKRLALEEREKAKQCKQKLERDFESATTRGAVMLEICRPWSPSERIRFCRGIQKHQDVPCFRESYCQVVGLTREWIGRASGEALQVAAQNVMLQDMEQRTGVRGSESCIFQLRNRLEMFIQYG